MKDKKDLTPFYIAIGAISFFVAVIPILDAFSTWMCNVFSLKNIKINSEASEYQAEEQQQTHVICFEVPSEELYEE